MTAQPERAPIIIYGAPRSGTTYLNAILNKHPDIFISNESRLFVWVHQTLNVLPHRDEVLFVHRDPFVRHLRERYPQLIRDFYCNLAPHARYWGDKYPNYASMPNHGTLDTVADLFPETRFIQIIRDGRDVMSSNLRKGWGNFERAHEIWMEHLDIGTAFGRERPSGFYHELRYEDLIRDDVKVAREVFDFLGIPMNEGAAQFCEAQQRDRTPFSKPTRNFVEGVGQSDWARLLTPVQQLESLDLIGRHLVMYGYETDESLCRLRAKAERAQSAGEDAPVLPWEPHQDVVHAERIERIRRMVHSVVPADGTVAVVSKGDKRLLQLDGRAGQHFPQDAEGAFLGFYPECSDQAIEQLEAIRARGAQYLVFPSTAEWWLDYYAEFREHLEQRYHLLAREDDTCLIYGLQADSEPLESAGASTHSSSSG